MEGGHHWLPELFEEGPQVVFVDAFRPGHVPGSVKAELVLNVDHVNLRVADGSGSGAIALRVALADPPADLALIGPDHVWFVDGSDPRAQVGIRRPSSRHEVRREGGDSAAARQARGDERDSHGLTHHTRLAEESDACSPSRLWDAERRKVIGCFRGDTSCPSTYCPGLSSALSTDIRVPPDLAPPRQLPAH